MRNYLQTLRLFSLDVRRFLFVTAGLGFAYFGIYTLIFNLYLLRLGYGPEFIGLVNGGGPFAFGLLSLSIGVLSRRLGSRNATLIGLSIMMSSFVLVPLTELLPPTWRAIGLIVTYLLIWLGGAFFVVNSAPFLMGATTEVTRNHAFAMFSALIPVAGFTGNLVGGFVPGLLADVLNLPLADPSPYRLTLWLAAAAFAPTLLVMATTGKVDTVQARQQQQEAGPIPLKLIVVIAIVMFLRVASEWAMRIFFNVYLDTTLHVSTALIGILLAGGQLLGLMALAAPMAIMRWGKQPIVSWGTLAMAGSLIPLVLFANWMMVGVGFMTMIGLVALTNPAFNIFSQERVLPGWRTTLSGAMSTATGFGIAITAFGGGYFITAFGYRSFFFLAAILATCGSLIFWTYTTFRTEDSIPPEPVVAFSESDD